MRRTRIIRPNVHADGNVLRSWHGRAMPATRVTAFNHHASIFESCPYVWWLVYVCVWVLLASRSRTSSAEALGRIVVFFNINLP